MSKNTQAALRPGTQVARLLQVCQSLKVTDDPEWADLIQKVVLKDDWRLAGKLLKYLSPAHSQQVVKRDPFLSMENGFAGDFSLGFVRDTPFCIGEGQLNRHTLLFGSSGSGKTNLLLFIVLQALERKIHLVYVDPKDDLAHAAGVLDYLPRSEMRINPLAPAGPDVPLDEHKNLFSKLYCELFGFLHRGQAVFQLGLDLAYQKSREHDRLPTLRDLLGVFKSTEFSMRVRGRGHESLNSIIEKLESLLTQLGPVVDCQKGFDIRRWHRERRVIGLGVGGLTLEAQNFLTMTYLLQYSLMFKTYGPRGRLNVLFVVDEARGLLGTHNRENLFMSEQFPKQREWGIGLVCADQVPSEVADFYFSNAATIVMFRLSNGNDLRKIKYSAGLTGEQVLANYTLKPGECLVRSSRYQDVHRVEVPFVRVEKHIPRGEVRRRMAGRMADLMRDVVESKALPRPALEGIERAFLDEIIRKPRPCSQVYKKLGLSSSAGYSLKKRLLQKDLVSDVPTNLGKGGRRAIFTVPEPDALACYGISLADLPGRGGVLHQYFQDQVRMAAEKLGFKAVVEQCLKGREPADVGLERNGLRVAVEVIVTTKARDNARSVQKNLGQGFDYVVLAFATFKSLRRTQALVKESSTPPVLERVRICLADSVAASLGEIIAVSG